MSIFQAKPHLTVPVIQPSINASGRSLDAEQVFKNLVDHNHQITEKRK